MELVLKGAYLYVREIYKLPTTSPYFTLPEKNVLLTLKIRK